MFHDLYEAYKHKYKDKPDARGNMLKESYKHGFLEGSRNATASVLTVTSEMFKGKIDDQLYDDFVNRINRQAAFREIGIEYVHDMLTK